MNAIEIGFQSLSAFGGVLGLWFIVRSLTEFRRGMREGIRCHLLKCNHCGKVLEWADNEGCTRDR